MRLDEFTESLERLALPAADQTENPDQQTLAEIRCLLSRAVCDDNFLADCVERELLLIGKMTRPRSGFVPFSTLARTGVHFALGYWPPGSSVAPHEHTAWALSTVCRNELQVLTFDREESYRRGELVPKNCFEAPAGKVGYIYGPCIHQPRNPSRRWSLSLHIISPQDGRDPNGRPDTVAGMADSDGILPLDPTIRSLHPAVILARQKMAHLEQLAMMLLGMKAAKARAVLGSLHRQGSSQLRRIIEMELPDIISSASSSQGWALRKAHEALVLTSNRTDDGICLWAESESGRHEVLRVNDVGQEALGYIVRNSTFMVADLPGKLRDEDRAMLALSLENSGVFQRVSH